MFIEKFKELVRYIKLERTHLMSPETQWYCENYHCIKEFVRLFLENNETVISLRQTGYRQCYDTTWQVKLLLGGQVIIASIIRDDMETPFSLLATLKDVRTHKDLLALDMHDQIYYD